MWEVSRVQLVHLIRPPLPSLLPLPTLLLLPLPTLLLPPLPTLLLLPLPTLLLLPLPTLLLLLPLLKRTQLPLLLPCQVHVLRQLRGHASIVRLCDVVELAEAVYVVMERVEGPGDLHDYIEAQPHGTLEEATARTFFRHMLSGLRHAHTRGFLHCDLKPANVRLQLNRDGSLTAVLVDWGLARQIDRQPTSLLMGTALYASPEQLTGYNASQAWGRAKLGPPADVWALGATCYQMLAGHAPFSGAAHEELVANVLALNYDLRPDLLSIEARQAIDSMLQILPSDRASLDELGQDPWVIDGGWAMPADVDSVLVSCNGATTPPPALSDDTANRAKRFLLYACYVTLAFGALVMGGATRNDHGGFELAGASPSSALEDSTEDGG